MCDSLETKKCTNCKIDILLNNFEVHSLHCLKNFYFCSKCEQPVNNNKKVEHEESHSETHCIVCNSKIEQHYLNDHLQYDCPKRKVKCQICDIDVEATKIEEHEDYCGSRTEKCLECNEFVMLKYKSIHLDSNHTFFKLADEPGPSPSWQNCRRMLFDYIPDLTMKQSQQDVSQKKKCVASREAKCKVIPNKNDKDESENDKKKFSSKLSAINFPEENSLTAEVDYSTKRNAVDTVSILPSFRQLHLNEEPITCTKPILKMNEQNKEKNYCFNNSEDTSKRNEDSQAKKMPKFCNFYKEHSNIDEKNGEKNIHNFRSTTKFKPKAKLNFDKNCYKDFSVQSKEFNKVQNVEIPCEFCLKLVPIQNLVDHQATCDLIYNKNIFKRKSHLNMQNFESEEELPCEICEKLFKLSQLENHQYYCKLKQVKSQLKSEAVVEKRNEKHETSYNQFNDFDSSAESQSALNTSSSQCKSISKSDKGAIPKTVKVSRKNRRAPSPPKS